LKALEKERSRRYETVNGLMQDLRRYLAGEPVEAAPPSRTYRIGKFARRHRPWILTAAAFALVLIAALVWSAWMAVRATRAEQESRAINEFLQRDVLGQASPYQQGGKPDPNLTVRAAVERAAASIDGRFRDQPAVEASLRNRIGSILTGLGAFQAGQPQLRRALQMRQSLLGDTDETTIESKEALASNLLGSGDGAGAEALLTEALATARASLAPGNRVRSQVEESLAWVKYNLGKYDEGIALVERVEKEAIGTSDAAHPAPGDVQYILFALHYDKGNYVEAKAALTKTFESSKKQYGEASSQTVALYGGFAMICMAQGLWQEAEEYYVKDLAQARRTFGPAHPNTLVAMYNLAQNHVQRGNYPQAEALFRENYQHRVTIYKPDHPRTMMFMNEWANFHTVQNKLVEADAIFAGYIPLLRKTLEAEHPTAIAANAGLAELRRRQKRYPEAEALLVKNVEWKQRKFGIGGDNTLLGMAALARVLVQHGHFADAETLARSASEGLAKADVWERFHARSLLGASFVGQRKFIEAEPNLIAGYEGMVQRKRFIPAGDLDALSEAGDRVVDFYRRQGKADQAMEWKRKIRH